MCERELKVNLVNSIHSKNTHGVKRVLAFLSVFFKLQ